MLVSRETRWDNVDLAALAQKIVRHVGKELPLNETIGTSTSSAVEQVNSALQCVIYCWITIAGEIETFWGTLVARQQPRCVGIVCGQIRDQGDLETALTERAARRDEFLDTVLLRRDVDPHRALVFHDQRCEPGRDTRAGNKGQLKL